MNLLFKKSIELESKTTRAKIELLEAEKELGYSSGKIWDPNLESLRVREKELEIENINSINRLASSEISPFPLQYWNATCFFTFSMFSLVVNLPADTVVRFAGSLSLSHGRVHLELDSYLRLLF